MIGRFALDTPINNVFHGNRGDGTSANRLSPADKLRETKVFTEAMEIHFTGMSCRLPGANSVTEFKRLLLENRCVVSEIPAERWTHAPFFHPKIGVPGKSYSFAAGVLSDIWGFDPAVFNFSPREAAQMDPQQRVLLQVAWEAIEDAGLLPQDLAGRNIGVYVGTSALDHSARLSHDPGTVDAYTMTGNTLSLVSNRLSYAFDLRGPSMTIDTACSSSLVALNEAEKALRSGTIDTAIVGGVNMLLSPTSFIGFSAARMLSPKGLCQPFAAGADGYVRAEGAVAFVLQRRKNGATGKSYARLAGAGTNSDGRTTAIALPSIEGQQNLLQQVYDMAEIDPADLSFVEAHGTGTFVGDPIEATAMSKALALRRQTPLPIGSVKSNIGHLEPASGLAGVLKALIAFETGVLPASLHAGDLNPNIDFEALNLVLARRNLPLDLAGRARFAGVSSFGFGGSNAHVILEKTAQSVPAPSTPKQGASRPTTILHTSAFSQTALRDLVQLYDQRIAGQDSGTTARMAADAARYRGTYPVRFAALGNTPEGLSDGLKFFLADKADRSWFTAKTDLKDQPAVFLFSGNGAQYAGMSLAAFQADAGFRATYEKISALFEKEAGWSLIDKLGADTLAEEMGRAEVAQPLLFADQVSLVSALAQRGLTPASGMAQI